MASATQKDAPEPQSGRAGSPGGTLSVFYPTWPEKCKKHPKSIGFTNDVNGIMCYRNTALIVLLHLPVFVNWLGIHLEDPCTISMSGKDCMACRLAHLSKAYWASDVLTEQITDLVRQVWKTSRNTFWGTVDASRQQDCPEYLTGIIQYLKGGAAYESTGYQDAEYQIKTSVTIEKMFQTVTRARDTCRSCGHVRYRDTNNYLATVQANIHKAGRKGCSLEDAITEYVGGELDGLHCDKCNQGTKWDSEDLFEQAPEVLIVQINRFVGTTGRNAAKVSFTEDLDITKYFNKDAKRCQDSPKYKLNAVVYHIGSQVVSGHYVCDVKGPNGEWFYVNDEEVKAVNTDITTRRPATKAVPYVLVYTRQPLTHQPPRRLPEAETGALGEEDTKQPGFEEAREWEGFPYSDDGAHTPEEEEDEDEVSDGVDIIELAGGLEEAPLAAKIRIGADAARPDEDEKWNGERRLEGQQASVKIKIEMDKVILVGQLKGVFKKVKRNTTFSAAAKPQGVTKSKVSPTKAALKK